MPSPAVHPVAALFPMLADDELAELAADIKANGLRLPIVRDKEGKTLIDGRNRLKACEIAGVKPAFRNLNIGQRAILLAKFYPELEKGGRGKKAEATNLAETAGFSGRRLRFN